MKKRITIFTFLCVAACQSGLLAQSHYPGQHEGKFSIKDKLVPAASSFNLNEVKLLDSRFSQNMEREEKWLLSISSKQLLHSFRTNAGIYDANEVGYFEI